MPDSLILPTSNAPILAALRERVLLCDGGTGARVQAMDLDLQRDFGGQENCTEILIRTRPDIVRDIHRSYLLAGADMVQTNTFGASPITLAEFGLEAEAFELNKRAGELAHEAVEEFKADGRRRFVIGSIGPGTKLPSLGHIDYDALEAALTVQARGLLAGGVDAFLVETQQDLLFAKAAINGCKIACREVNATVPIFCQVTIETTGTLLVGSDIAAAATVLRAMDVDMIGLNCATGPQEMAEHVKWLSESWPGFVSVQPNAGLPELVDGKTRYPLTPDELARWLERFIAEDGVNLVGGCCGTDVQHIAALDQMLRKRDGGNWRPAPKERSVLWVPAVASLYSQVPLRQENAYFAIGERCNANGSAKFRKLQEAGDWDGCVEMGREQQREGSHALDICTAFVGRDEIKEMREVVGRMRGHVAVPLVIDSTEYPVLEGTLKLYGGKAILNSINFEDGEEPAHKRLELAKRFGTAVIALTIDEAGMAKDADAKLRIAHRLYDFAVNRHGLDPSDLMFDPLTFTIATGNEDDRKLGLETLNAIERISKEMPACQIVLGLSNISFGLNPAARHVLNSVFLDHAVRRGMTGAIVHVSKIMPLHKIAEEEVKVAEDLIFDRRSEGYDPLQRLLELFADRKAEKSAAKERAEDVETRLKERIVEGDKQGLEDDLKEALQKHKPLDIINVILLDGMKVVGDLFGAGKMQLPFVLKSAETMKTAVAFLEPLMERVEGQQKGTIVLATVKGDVHDIGKNLVDIILTNNGYRVVNLGIKQPIASIMSAAREHQAHAIGMSGLLVKSTVVMKDNLNELTREGFEVPVILGGAALTRRYVEEDCVAAYACGRVAYAGDAFDGLGLMDRIVGNDFDGYLSAVQARNKGRPTNQRRKLGQAADPANREERPVDWDEIALRRAELQKDVAVPTPPFWGARVIEHAEVKALLPYLNERMLYQFHWGYRKDGRTLDEYMEWAKRELRPILNRMADQAAREKILNPQAAYGYWPAASDGDSIVLFAPEDADREVARFALPRQNKTGGLCIADFLKPVDAKTASGAPLRDVLGLQVVTVGQHASDVAREWFADNRYQDYLYLHGLGVEMAEAMAEYVHKRIRGELGFAADEARSMEDMLRQGYRGSRYSFGYPACPNLQDQEALLRLLGAERIGVELSDEYQLHPEQSTSAIVLHHPQAKYFSV